MLKLVVDNTKNLEHRTITCRNSCDLFDPITESCSIKKNVKVDSSNEVNRCGHFISRDNPSNDSPSNFRFIMMGEEEDFLIDDDEIFYDLVGNTIKDEDSKYPLQPDFPANREDAVWYVSPEQTFGCWIVNKYKKPLPIPRNREEAEKGWSQKVYKSPIPLHDHKSSTSLASKMAWYIDEDGYGQYALLINGKVSTISSPRPLNWRKPH